MSDTAYPVNAGLSTENTADDSVFTGRTRVFDAINSWIGTRSDRIFLLSGPAGSGKSAIARRLVDLSQAGAAPNGWSHLQPGCISFAHFCQAFRDSTLRPLRVIEQWAGKLATQHEICRQALLKPDYLRDTNLSVNVHVQEATPGANVYGAQVSVIVEGEINPSDAFDHLVRRPLEQLFQSGYPNTMLVLFDALDESFSLAVRFGLVSLLARADLPHRVRFILTSRSDPRVLEAFGAASLDLGNPQDIDDVRVYCLERLASGTESKRSPIANRVAKAAAGNFLFARYVIDDLLRDGTRLEALPDSFPIPATLEDLYSEFLHRELATQDEDWSRKYRPILAALSVARGDGLSTTQIASITGVQESAVRDSLRVCAQYLTGVWPEGPFRIYHHSFRDFLNHRHHTIEYESNQLVANYFVSAHHDEWQKSDDYGLTYTPAHLTAALRESPDNRQRKHLAQQLASTLCDLDFMQSKVYRKGVDSYLRDLSEASEALADMPEVLAVDSVRRILDREAHYLRVWMPDANPSFLLQQFHNRAASLGLVGLSSAAGAELDAANDFHLRVRWRKGGESSRLLRTFTEHSGLVTAVDVMADGRVVTGASDNTIRVWDPEIGASEPPLKTDEWVWSISAKDHVVVAGIDDGSLVVWNRVSGRVDSYRADSRPIHRLVFTSDGTLVSASDDSIRVWDLKSGESTILFRDQRRGRALLPDGEGRLLAGSVDGCVRRWDVHSGAEELLYRHGEAVVSIAMARGGRIISAAPDSLVIWDPISGKTTPILGLGNGINALLVLDGDRLITGSEDHTIKILDLATWQLEPLYGHFLAVNGLALTSKRRLVSVSDDSTAKVWDVTSPSSQTDVESVHRSSVYPVGVTPDRTMVSGSADCTVKLWDFESGRLKSTLSGHRGPVDGIAVTPQGQVISTGGWSFEPEKCSVLSWDLLSGEAEPMAFDANWPDMLMSTPDGNVVGATRRGVLLIWELNPRPDLSKVIQLNRSTRSHGDRLLFSLSVARDGRIAAGWDDATITLTDPQTEETEAIVVGSEITHTAIIATSDGGLIVGSSDGKIRILGRSGRLQELRGHKGVVHALALEDDRFLLSGSHDKTLRLWDLSAGTLLAVVGLDGAPQGVATASPRNFLIGDVTGAVYRLEVHQPR